MPSGSLRPTSLHRYVVTGAVLGFCLGTALAILGPDVPMTSLLWEVVVFGVLGAALITLVSCLVYLVVDWRRHRPRL